MPIPIPLPGLDDAAPGLPQHLLRELIVQRPSDAYGADGSATKTWTTYSLRGRITRASSDESTADGRQQSLVSAELVSTSAVQTEDRIVDGDDIYVVLGDSAAIWSASAIHHYQTGLREA